MDESINRDATLLRQSAEWGMRQFQALFPCVKDKFKFEVNGERQISLRVLVHLFNWRTNTVGCNQIRTVFMPWLEANAYEMTTMFRKSK